MATSVENSGHQEVSMIEQMRNERDKGFSAATIVPIGDKRLMFLAGEIGRDASGQVTAGDFEDEVRQCFANIAMTLGRAGGTFDAVVKIVVYFNDLSTYATYAKVRAELFGDHWPASTAVAAPQLLLGANIEIEMTAVI
jgi:enamine deaminase RidA (YjgF/YER057c/UK114 family)